MISIRGSSFDSLACEDPITDLNLGHFRLLRDRIHARLHEVGSPHADVQVGLFPWMYGALGAVPARTMVVFLRPSIINLTRQNVPTIDGGTPDIEAQWWGDAGDPAVTRLRPALCDAGLKATPPDESGGWNCYLTHLIKEASRTEEESDMSAKARGSRTRLWADVLAWEIETVGPEHLICVGRSTHDGVRMLQRQGLIPELPIDGTPGYEGRGPDDDVRQRLGEAMRAALEENPAAA